jgi:hypothetical protein
VIIATIKRPPGIQERTKLPEASSNKLATNIKAKEDRSCA